MQNRIFKISALLLLVAAGMWTLWMLGVMFYYGSYIIQQSSFPRGGEAQLGAWIGFLYALPGLMLFVVVGWTNRRVLPRVVVLAPFVFFLAVCGYFAYLRALVAMVASP